MQHRTPGDFLRTCRRSAGFTQLELAQLAGFESRSHLSRVERGERNPKLAQALRYEALFNIPLSKVAPRLCEHALNGLWEDIESSLHTCNRSHGPRCNRKCEVLKEAKERIERMSNA